MEFKIPCGLSAKSETIVKESDTAANWGSGGLSVYSTPHMIALMENAAYKAVQSELPPGWTTVGINLTVSHSSATPVGMKVWAKATLIKAEGRALDFEITAYDEAGEIGSAKHGRFIVNEEKFLAKVAAKRG